jgi:zinc transport system substrate-binding protein
MNLTKRICLILGLFLFANAASAADAGDAFVAYTSVSPVAAVMQRVGAGHWQARSVVEEGKDPHTFALTPRKAAEFSAARVYVAVGIEMDPVVLSRAPASLIVADVELPPEARTGKGPVDPDDEDGHDPHVWLDPEGLVATARAASTAFISVDPAHKADYEASLAKFEADVAAASAKAVNILKPYKGRRFYVQHDAFTRYAAHFGLVQVAVEEHEKEPTGMRLAEVTRMMQADGAKALFAQPGHNPRPLEVIAKPIGATIEILDPMLPDPVEGLVTDADLLAKSFKAVSTGKETR